MKRKANSASHILSKLTSNKKLTGHLTYRRLLKALGNRAFGIALLFFALPSALPFSAIPGVSFIFSVPILLFSVQMMFGRKTFWLPKIIGNKKISQKTVTKIIHGALPYITKIERFLRPRWYFMTSRRMEIFNGIIISFLAILLMLPIPLSNFIVALLIIIFGLGFVQKDGLFVTLGYLATIIYVGFVYILIFAAVKKFIAWA